MNPWIASITQGVVALDRPAQQQPRDRDDDESCMNHSCPACSPHPPSAILYGPLVPSMLTSPTQCHPVWPTRAQHAHRTHPVLSSSPFSPTPVPPSLPGLLYASPSRFHVLSIHAPTVCVLCPAPCTLHPIAISRHSRCCGVRKSAILQFHRPLGCSPNGSCLKAWARLV